MPTRLASSDGAGTAQQAKTTEQSRRPKQNNVRKMQTPVEIFKHVPQPHIKCDVACSVQRTAYMCVWVSVLKGDEACRFDTTRDLAISTASRRSRVGWCC